jgi:hypothetical protein
MDAMESAHTNAPHSGPRVLLRQGAGMLGGPLVWLAQFQLNYALVPRMCRAGTTLPLHLVFLAALLLVAGAGFLAWRTWRTAGAEWPSSNEGGPVGRSGLLGALGLMTSALFFLVVLAQWIPAFVVEPCLE